MKTQNVLKRVVAIHDISCAGKCSLTVALPIISACGIECSVLPTAILSTHTGGFSGFTYRDLTCDLLAIAGHWKLEGFDIHAMYSGFLGSFEQIEVIKKIFSMFKTKENVIIIDPVMADNGKLYGIFPKEFPKGMASLCTAADIIVPNITEACLMTDTEYMQPPHSKEFIDGLLKKLSAICKKVVLTGVSLIKGQIGAAVFDANNNSSDFYFRDEIEGYFHGTGDVFGSAFTSAFVKGFSMADSAKIAVDFVVAAILRTKNAGTDPKYGVDFENCLPELINSINNNN